jgi:hypothetical protein
MVWLLQNMHGRVCKTFVQQKMEEELLANMFDLAQIYMIAL